jgi:hypothetical protein
MFIMVSGVAASDTCLRMILSDNRRTRLQIMR